MAVTPLVDLSWKYVNPDAWGKRAGAIRAARIPGLGLETSDTLGWLIPADGATLNMMTWLKSSQSPADADEFTLAFKHVNDASPAESWIAVSFDIVAADVTDASENGTFNLNTMVDGTLVQSLSINNGSVVGAHETLTAAAPALNVFGVSVLDSTSNAVDGTLAAHPGGLNAIGATKTITMTEASNSSTITIAVHQTSDPEVATFNAVDETGVFMWSGTEWVTIFATCTFV